MTNHQLSKPGTQLFHRVMDSSTHEWPESFDQRGPSKLHETVSQLITILDDQDPVYVGHTVEEKDGSVVQGLVIALTDTLLIRTTISGGEVTTEALPLKSAESVEVLRVARLLDEQSDWPNKLRFTMTIGGGTITFPVSKHPSRLQQEETLPAMKAIFKSM